MDGNIKIGHKFLLSQITRFKTVHIPVIWIPAQICLEQICINPKGIRQDSLM